MDPWLFVTITQFSFFWFWGAISGNTDGTIRYMQEHTNNMSTGFLFAFLSFVRISFESSYLPIVARFFLIESFLFRSDNDHFQRKKTFLQRQWWRAKNKKCHSQKMYAENREKHRHRHWGIRPPKRHSFKFHVIKDPMVSETLSLILLLFYFNVKVFLRFCGPPPWILDNFFTPVDILTKLSRKIIISTRREVTFAGEESDFHLSNNSNNNCFENEWPF